MVRGYGAGMALSSNTITAGGAAKFTGGLYRPLATAYRMSFSREINLGPAQHEFELFCQPLLNARSQQCIGVEILLRWNNPRQGWISPDVFIPIAEEHHLIVPLTRYVMAETIRQRHVFPDE